MNKKVQTSLVALLVFATFTFCKDSYVKNSGTKSIKDSCCIDTFKFKYEAKIHGRIKKVDENIYVGMISPGIKINDKEYKKFVFGDSINVIALVRQDSNKLSYINNARNLKSIGQEDFQENALLYFDKKLNDRWKVNIDSSYFWRREITFAGMEHNYNGNVYVYNVDADEGYSDIGNRISKIYYSKEKGFLKFEIKTHWFPVEVNKSE